MANRGEKFGRWDDRSAIYRTDGGGVSWRRLAITFLVASAALAGLRALSRAVGAEDIAVAILGVGSVALLAVYVPWRRRRNRRLTGSSTEWPKAS